MPTTAAIPAPELDSGLDVLRFAHQRRADALAAEADLLYAAVTWAEQHPPEIDALAATWKTPGGDTGLPLAGPGAPLVSEFCIAEFALAIGESTDSGRSRIADAVELKYRLPRHWARVRSGQLPAWRARRIAQATLGLSREAADHVDRQLAHCAHRVGPASLDRLVAEAVDRFMPATAIEAAERAADGRHLTIHHDHVTFNGTSRIEGELDLADALDLEDALQREAQALADAGCDASLDVRRSMAAGQLARRQLALDLAADADAAAATPRARKPREVVLYVHLSEDAIRGSSNRALELARIENHQLGVTADQVRSWCANPDTAVTVRPVIDLSDHLHTDAYEVPDRLREQTELRDHSCVFPWCTRAARRCQCDHVIPHNRGGPTCSCNIAPLCSRHHRLKTHTTWMYSVLEPGSYLWSSPHGLQFLSGTDGTLDVTGQHRASRSTDPPHH